MTDIVERLETYQIADSLLEMAQEVELGTLQLTVPVAAFLRESADRINRQDLEIKILREENERLRANAKLERLLSFQHGVRSVYQQARHEGRDDLAQWIECRYPLVTANTQEMRDE